MDQMTTFMCSLHYQWEKKRFTYLLTASSVRASPVLWRPITTHFPSSRACFASRTAAGTLADMHMCRKKRWHHQFHNVTIQKWLDSVRQWCRVSCIDKPIEETLVCMANRNWGDSDLVQHFTKLLTSQNLSLYRQDFYNREETDCTNVQCCNTWWFAQYSRQSWFWLGFFSCSASKAHMSSVRKALQK